MIRTLSDDARRDVAWFLEFAAAFRGLVRRVSPAPSGRPRLRVIQGGKRPR
jgi:hypothetical protein